MNTLKNHWKPNENQCKNSFSQCQKNTDQGKTPKSIVNTMVFDFFYQKPNENQRFWASSKNMQKKQNSIDFTNIQKPNENQSKMQTNIKNLMKINIFWCL